MVDSFLSMDIFPSFKSFQQSKDEQGAFTIDQKDLEEIKKIPPIEQSKQNNNSFETTKKSNSNPLTQCDICLVPISSQTVYDTHIKGRKHQTQLTNLLSKNPEYKSLTYDELCSKKQDGSEIILTENHIPSPLIPTKKLNCHVCNVSCNSEQMFDNHVAGKKHQSKLKLANFINPAPVRIVPDNNPSSSNYCDICSLKLNSEDELTEHLAQKRHQTRVKEAEICAKEANDMNINFDDYKISTTDTDKDSFNYQCTKCNKKFRNKMQVIDHLKSAPHIRFSNQPNDQRLSSKANRGNRQATRGAIPARKQTFPSSRGSSKPVGRSRPYRSQRSSWNQPVDSQNIFGAFDPKNEVTFPSTNNYSSTKRSIQYEENPHEYDGFYPKRTRTYNNQDNNSQNFYTNDGNYNDPYSTENINYNNQSSVSQPPWQYQAESYYDQQQYSNTGSSYMDPNYYLSNQPPLPDYEQPPPPLPNYPPPSSYYTNTENPGTNHFYPNSFHS